MTALLSVLLPSVALIAAMFLAAVLWDGFQTLVLPRRVTQRFRITNLFYKSLWPLWRQIGRRLAPGRRESWLSVFGPLSLVLLIAVWASSLILGFATLLWGLGVSLHAPEPQPGFGSYLYLSATSFFTLGYGDVTAASGGGRFLTNIEAGIGFGFLAIVIGYLPVLYGAFSRREVNISMLDARASSPPSAGELLRRHADCPQFSELRELLRDWERWAAELLESHLSYPILMAYRSQHDRQSWLGSMTAILDSCALILAWLPQGPVWQARLTFAMARHAIIDLALVFDAAPVAPLADRLPESDQNRLRQLLENAGLTLTDAEKSDATLRELRAQYEPYVNSLAESLMLPLPGFLPEGKVVDNWQTSAWEHDDHF